MREFIRSFFDWTQQRFWKTGILVWLGFNVMFNFAPYLFLLPSGFLRGKMPSFFSYITGGELLIIAVAIAADSMGAIILELLKPANTKIKWLIFALIVLLAIVLAASFSFVDVKSLNTESGQANLPAARVLLLSFIIFVSSFSISLMTRSYMESYS